MENLVELKNDEVKKVDGGWYFFPSWAPLYFGLDFRSGIYDGVNDTAGSMCEC